MEFSEAQVRLIRDLAMEVDLRRRQIGAPIPQRVRDLLHYVSVCGHQSPLPPTELEQDNDDLIDTITAAEILGCSTRHVRRIAADLDGTKHGRDWIFNRHQVTEYTEARNANARRHPHQGHQAIPGRVA